MVNESETKSFFYTFLEIFKTIAIVLIVAFLVKKFLVQPFIVDGQSMEPNFHNNEYVLVDKISYRFREPKEGEIVVFKAPTQQGVNYIKRIIGRPGDEIEINQGKVYVNGYPLSEPYLKTNESTIVNSTVYDFKEILGKDEFFVLGDNRASSSDSRDWGVMTRDRIIGRTFAIIYPLDKFSLISLPNYSLAKEQ